MLGYILFGGSCYGFGLLLLGKFDFFVVGCWIYVGCVGIGFGDVDLWWFSCSVVKGGILCLLVIV